MDFVTTIMLTAVIYVTIIPLYFMSANYRKPKKNIILGVTVPTAYQDSPEVQAIVKSFLTQLRIFAVTACIAGLLMFVVPTMSIQITILLVLLLLVIVCDGLIFIKANRALTALKRKSQWLTEKRSASVADLRAMEEKNRPIQKIWFILPCIIAAVPLIPMVLELVRGEHDWGQILAYVLTVIWIPLMIVLAEAFRRQNAEIVGTVSDLNVITTRIRRREYMRMSVFSTWLLAILGLGIWFQPTATGPMFLFVGVVIIMSVALGIYAVSAEFAVRRAQEKYTKLAGDTLEVDTDDLWIWGMFYHNKEDKRMLINDRVGMNMTMNFAKPLGKIVMGICALILLLMPAVGIWLMVLETSPITYSVEGNVITATHLTARSFDVGEDFQFEFLGEFPDGMRTGGTAIGALRTGWFQLDGIGRVYVMAHTDELPLVLITTAEGERFLFNVKDAFRPLGIEIRTGS